jgi:hypothetical protein
MFNSVVEMPLPETALLQRYAASGEYTDCFATHIPVPSSLPEYVTAFYTTALFKAERRILDWLASLPSTDDEASQLARGTRNVFAAWTVEDRNDDQLLLIDVRQQTGSWFMHEAQGSRSRLYFGSVVFRREATPTGRELRWTYRSLLGMHRFYSRALLSAARSRVSKMANGSR